MKGWRGDTATPTVIPTHDHRLTRLPCCISFCLSLPPALGQQTVVTAGLGLERFTSKGLMILQRNFLDIYPYDRWVEHPMPFFQRDQRVIPTELNMREGRTEPPPSLTESDLISLMDKNGIGTDATIAQHIKTILDRVTCRTPPALCWAWPVPTTFSHFVSLLVIRCVCCCSPVRVTRLI